MANVRLPPHEGKCGTLLNEGKLREAVDNYLGGYAPPRKLFKRAAYERIRTAAHDRMEEELRRIGVPLGEKALHIFVLTNDLRRHLHEYFNRLPRHGSSCCCRSTTGGSSHRYCGFLRRSSH